MTETAEGTRVLRFGIAGLGVASTLSLPQLVGRSNIQVTAAADVRKEALEKFARDFGGETYNNVEELCRSPNVDVVCIYTPNHLHAEHVITAAEHHKHVIVTKPMADSIEECEAMNAAAERNGVKLMCPTQSFQAPVRRIREIVKSGELGKLGMINTWHFNEFMYRPRAAWELDPDRCGNVIYNQAPHHVDIIRLIGGGIVRSVRAMTGTWDPSRRVEGAWAAYLEFEDGTPATMVYNGYAHFDTAELTFWVAESARDPEENLRARRALAAAEGDEERMKESWRYAGGRERPGRGPVRDLSIFGLTIVSCERGDIRQSPDGLIIYGDDRRWEVPIAKGAGIGGAASEEMYSAVIHDRPVRDDGRWGEATQEVVLAIMESARKREEVFLSHQVAARD